MIHDDRLGSFTEVIERGAFTAALRPSVPVLVDHEPFRVADRCGRVWQTHAGLYATVDVLEASVPMVRDLTRAARRRVPGGGLRASVKWALDGLETRWSEPPARVRTIIAVSELLDVSVTIDPAYRSTWLEVDSEAARRRIALEELAALERELQHERSL